MTRLPRDLDAEVLVAKLARLGYSKQRQRGSHMTVHTEQLGGHTVWIPNHSPIAVGTLGNLLRGIAAHFGWTVAELLQQLEL